MEFKDVINNRYSCKNFDGRKVERAALQEILEAARKAPTAKKFTRISSLCHRKWGRISKDRSLYAVSLSCRYRNHGNL